MEEPLSLSPALYVARRTGVFMLIVDVLHFSSFWDSSNDRVHRAGLDVDPSGPNQCTFPWKIVLTEWEREGSSGVTFVGEACIIEFSFLSAYLVIFGMIKVPVLQREN